MNIAIWGAQALLALAFLVSGGTKVMPSAVATQLMKKGLSEAQVKTIGGLELLAAIGLILPTALKVLPVLTPAAAVGVVLLMIGAIAFHVRLGESDGRLAANVVLLLLALGVAGARFGPYPV
jgi:uncharacterized membrane protein YphA (DoxX/SURF4 family)